MVNATGKGKSKQKRTLKNAKGRGAWGRVAVLGGQGKLYGDNANGQTLRAGT